MFRLIATRTFVPHSSSCYNASAEQIIKKVSNISTQLCQTRTAQIAPENGTKFSDLELDALANIITHELIYYHQVNEIGCFLDQERDDAPTSPNQLTLRKKIGDLCAKIGIASEQYLLGPAGYLTSHMVSQQRHYLGLLTHSILVCLGGCSFKGVEMTSSISINEILAELVEIAKTAWSMVALLKKTNQTAFEKYTKPDIPLFKTIQILPNESVFGNYNC
jgi:hypothetical protein